MILADVDIIEAMENGDIVVDPPIEPEQIQPASLDIRMGETVIDEATGERLEPEDGVFRLWPWRFYLGSTLDSVSISNKLTAEITGRSTFAREGMFPHLVAGYTDPGWDGILTLEMLNVSSTPVDIEIGERVAQLSFQETLSESSGYEGKYQGADGPEGSKR